MCGRYTLAAPDPGAIRSQFGIAESVSVRRRYNVAPGDEVLAVTTDRDGRPRGELLRWGLVPTWAKRPGIGLKLINARVETAAQRPVFRRAFERYRCLIVADGFYEWRRTGHRDKEAFHIAPRDGHPFAFAGLWSIWHGDDLGTLRTCAILTTAANAAISPLHNRMPVILARDNEAAWLHGTYASASSGNVLAGLAADDTAIVPVGRAVNDARYDGPECLAPPSRTAQPALF